MKLLKRIRALRSRLADIATGLALYETKAKKFHREMHAAREGNRPAAYRQAKARYHYWTAKQAKAHAARHHLRPVVKRLLKKLARKEPIVVFDHGHPVKVLGGSPEERIRKFFAYARKHWHDYYSEAGEYVLRNVFDNLGLTGKRSDCSRTSIEARRVCKLRTITTEPRYTGSCLTFGREVSRHYAETHTGVWVIFGEGDGFHMGTSNGEGPFIWEHGRPELDIGHFDEYSPVRFRAVD